MSPATWDYFKNSNPLKYRRDIDSRGCVSLTPPASAFMEKAQCWRRRGAALLLKPTSLRLLVHPFWMSIPPMGMSQLSNRSLAWQRFRFFVARRPEASADHKQSHADAGMKGVEQEVVVIHVIDVAIVGK